MSTTILSVGLATLIIFSALTFIALRIRSRFRYLDRQLAGVLKRIDEKAQETQNATALQQLGLGFPVFYGDWSIDAFLGKFLVQCLTERRPGTVLELGSGSSTVLIARCLELLGSRNTRHIAVDHDARFIEITRVNLELNGLADTVDLWLCPLISNPETGKLWYGGLPEKLDGRIDLLIIDGPPGQLQTESRLPALPVLLPFLSENCVIILDDASRLDERSIVRKWVEANPQFTLDLLTQGHGLAILRRQPAETCSTASVPRLPDKPLQVASA
jgi:predicted O-methyltransferase YrrM